MAELTKRAKSALLMNEHQSLFQCPLCFSSMEVAEMSRLECENNHSFDIAKQGYVNLLAQHHKTKYDKELFEARKKLIGSGFYNPLTRFLCEIMDENNQLEYILDAGSGEGSHLQRIVSELHHQVTGVGIDISKEGILAAAKEYPEMIWGVADLAACPIGSEQIDVIVNILSPANYAEFDRMLRQDGLLLKVMPAEGYLQELRKIIYHNTDKEVYVNENTLDKIEERFDVKRNERVTYKVQLEAPIMEALIRMTPLTWSLSEERLTEVINDGLTEITVDLIVVVGKKRSILK